MEQITLESLGLDQDALQEKLVEALCQKLLTGTYFDEDGDKYTGSTSLHRELDKAIREQVEATVVRVAEETLTPQVEQLVTGAEMRRHNSYGEPIGEPRTFKEYLDETTQKWLDEKVDKKGYTGGYDDKVQSRLSWMIGRHIAAGVKQHLNEVLGGASEIVMTAMESAVSVARADIEAAVQKAKSCE